MNTPAHLLIGAAAFGRGAQPAVVWGALIGALAPDLSLYLMAGWALYVAQIPAEVVFRELYYSDSWQAVFSIDNSVFVWGALLGVALWRRAGWAIALTGAAVLHLLLDFPLHHDDGRAHFWPLSGWIFESPISYWDRRHGAGWVAPLGAAICTVAAVVLWQRRPGWLLGSLYAALLAAELMVARVWMFVFGT